MVLQSVQGIGNIIVELLTGGKRCIYSSVKKKNATEKETSLSFLNVQYMLKESLKFGATNLNPPMRFPTYRA